MLFETILHKGVTVFFGASTRIMETDADIFEDLGLIFAICDSHGQRIAFMGVSFYVFFGRVWGGFGEGFVLV